jgi:phosphoribosylglycinamide formyltransferase 1
LAAKLLNLFENNPIFLSMRNIAVFGSGRGSNCAAIIEAMRRGEIPGARICVIISNASTAGILELGRTNGIPSFHLSGKNFLREEDFARALLDALRAHGTEFIVLAGYMKHLPDSIVSAFRGRILNVHPALLPKFGGSGMYGMNVHRAVIEAGEKESGATVHLVDEEYDHGAIVLQRLVPVIDGDTPESLAARVLAVEHQLLPEALRRVIEGSAAYHQKE